MAGSQSVWEIAKYLFAAIFHEDSHGGVGRLYCGDSNGHVHFESFSSHFSLTLRTPVLFIFRQATGIGHGMKYILTSLDECPGKRRGRLQSFYLSMKERDKHGQSELKSIGFKHCADCQCSRSSNFSRSQVHCLREDELKAQTDPSRVRNWSLISQAPERVWGAELKTQAEGNKHRLARGQLWKQLFTSTAYLQVAVNYDKRSHTKTIKSS